MKNNFIERKQKAKEKSEEHSQDVKTPEGKNGFVYIFIYTCLHIYIHNIYRLRSCIKL